MKAFTVRLDRERASAVEELCKLNYTSAAGVIKAAVDGVISFAKANGGRLPMAPVEGMEAGHAGGQGREEAGVAAGKGVAA